MVFLAYASARTTRLLLQLEPRDGVRVPPHVSTFQRDSLASASASVSQTTPPPSPPSTPARISPAVLFIIVILAVIFFASGLLHLLVRFLIRKSPVSASASSNRSGGQYTAGDEAGPDALQRQLQQLFHLHDLGVDQAFIDALPVFLYREIVGPKEPFDCAVCLCEFAATDPLRLLPACGHAFHLACIDTWLLSNSTCPLCRGTLFTPSLAVENPIFNFEEHREEDGVPGNHSDGFPSLPGGRKPGEAEEIVEEKSIFPVRLGKFTRLSNGDDGNNVDCMGGEITNVRAEQGETSSSNLDARRCYSMGSYQYVVGDANLRVVLSSGSMRFSDVKNGRVRGPNGNLTADGGEDGKRLGIGSRGESFSVSKIWLWSSQKGKYPVSSDASSLDGGLPWLQTSMGDA